MKARSVNEQYIIIFIAIVASVASAHGQADPHREFDRLCSFDVLNSEATVGPDFLLKISFQGAPISGIRITLNKAINASGNGIIAAAITDTSGLARFRAIPKGGYYLDSSEGLLFRGSSLLIKVKAGHAPDEKVVVKWPEHFIAVRNLRGRFSIAEALGDPTVPLRNAVIELREIYNARLIESTQTDPNGDFEFTTRDPGIYAIRLVLPEKDQPGTESRDLAIELGSEGKEYSIPEMKIVQSDCYGIQLFRRSTSDDRWEAQ